MAHDDVLFRSRFSFRAVRVSLPSTFVASLAASLVLAGCTPSLGDKCSISTDCSLQGERQCDTSQPNGYCTIFNCGPNTCPDYGACVLFHAKVQGCGYSDRSPSRTGRTFCMANCTSDSDCRTGDGYVCRDPRKEPWNATIIDDNQEHRVCMLNPGGETTDRDAGADAATPPVCEPSGPDAGELPVVDAGATDAGNAGDAGDAGADAGDGGDAGDAGDAGPSDAGVTDATLR